MRSVSVTERQETSRVARAAVMGVCLLVLVFSVGAYISHYNAERHPEAAAQQQPRDAAQAEASPQRAAPREAAGARKVR